MTPAASPGRRYLALYLPNLASDAWRAEAAPARSRTGASAIGASVSGNAPPIGDAIRARTVHGSGNDVVVFTERQGNAVRVTALTPAARAAGLVDGLTLADARARVPATTAIERDRDAEARRLARLVAGLSRYTPSVQPDPPDGVLLDIAGCVHPFAGERGLIADLRHRLLADGLTVRLGLGRTPEAARARARFGATPEADLASLPVEALEADGEATTALRRAGLKRVADLAQRPRAMLAARFGDLALRLGRLLEEEDRRITRAPAPAPVFALRRFAEPIGRLEDAFACLEALLGETAAILRARHRGGRRFAARFFRSDGAVPGLAVETGRPTRDAALVMRLFRERLDTLVDPIDPGFGFDAIRLDIPVTDPLLPAQDTLDQAASRQESLAELIDRIAARLGRASVVRAAPYASHIPESATVAIPPEHPVAWPPAQAGEPPLRPLVLFDPPQPVEATYGLPDGPPMRFVWRRCAHRVTRWEGPERIAAEWWRRRIDAAAWAARDAADRPLSLPAGAAGLTRDYYRVEDEAGHRFWLFRHGLQGRERDAPAWFLHGLFA